jgi:hypothetical protein
MSFSRIRQPVRNACPASIFSGLFQLCILHITTFKYISPFVSSEYIIIQVIASHVWKSALLEIVLRNLKARMNISDSKIKKKKRVLRDQVVGT